MMLGVILRTPLSNTFAASEGSVLVITMPLMPSSSGSQFSALHSNQPDTRDGRRGIRMNALVPCADCSRECEMPHRQKYWFCTAFAIDIANKSKLLPSSREALQNNT